MARGDAAARSRRSGGLPGVRVGANPLLRVLRAQRHPDGPLDSGRGRARLRAHADPGAAGPVQGPPERGHRAAQRRCHRPGRGRPRPWHGVVSDLRDGLQDPGRQHPQRRVARSDAGQDCRGLHALPLARARHRRRRRSRRLRLRLQLRLCPAHCLGRCTDAAAQGDQPPRALRPSLRRLRPDAHGRAGRAPARLSTQHPGLRARRHAGAPVQARRRGPAEAGPVPDRHLRARATAREGHRRARLLPRTPPGSWPT